MRNYSDIEFVLKHFESGRYEYRDGQIFSNGKLLKGSKKGKGGYLAFCLKDRGSKIRPSFHLVIYALVHGIDELKKHETIDHVDGDKYNNRIENLEGCSVVENNHRWHMRYYQK